MRRRGRGDGGSVEDELDRLRRRAQRERDARLEAEAIAETATRDLYFTVERLEQLNQELRDANEVKDRLISVTAEQMALPLASIQQLSQALDRRWDDIEERNRRLYIGMVSRQSSRVSTYVQDLLVVAQLGTGGLEVELDEVRLLEVVEAALDALPSGDQVTLDCGDEVVRADRRHLRRILDGLLANAREHGAPPISVTVTRARRSVDLVVADEGPGVGEDFRARLFEPFTTAHTFDPADQPHAGVGLAICKHLAGQQGGSLRFEPNEPTGSRFVLTLPSA